MNLVYETQQILEHAGYSIRSTDSEETFDFEDETLYGFVKIYGSVEAIMATWEQQQDTFLKRHASNIRANPPKAWNAYSVFLTASDATSEARVSLCKIEDDFRGTRKIARSNLTTLDDVQQALYPLLPLANRVHLIEGVGPKLEERLRSLRPNEIKALLNSDIREIIAVAEVEDP
jgi:hypothetical protein